MRRVRWFGVVGVLLGLTACDDSQPASGSCTPACRSGFTCVSGACISACNPLCGAGETCVADGAGTRCVAGVVPDGGGIPDATVLPDGATVDLPQVPIDVPPGSDVQFPPTDTPVVPTDVGDGGRAPCGMSGQPCCGFAGRAPTTCAPGSLCNSTTMRCEAFAPDVGECTATATCPAGQVCSFGAGTCGGGMRSCLRCVAPPAGGTPAGTPCGRGLPVNCATGICANNRCTTTCVPGAAGDAACRMIDPMTVCAELASRAVAGGPVTTYGACIRSCRRDADCTGTQKCLSSSSALGDTVILTCREPFGMIANGARCPARPTLTDAGLDDPGMYCQSEFCFGPETDPYCSQFCATDADCPSSAFACMPVPITRPSGIGAGVPLGMCVRR